MCIGLPCQITGIHQQTPNTAIAEVNNVQREIDISLITNPDTPVETLIGRWVLVHVGFAMNLLDEQEAKDTLAALQSMAEEESDVNYLLQGELGNIN